MRNATNKTGFTLVESLVSMALLGLVIAGSYVLMNRSAQLGRASRNHYLAINLGKNRIERAHTMPYSQLSLLAESAVVVNDNGVPLSSGDFRRTTIVNTNAVPGLSETNIIYGGSSTNTGLTAVTVICEMRNVQTRNFHGESESVSSLFTEYLKLD